MPKKRERSPEEYYRGRIRELEKEVRQLKRRIKELERYDRDIELTHEVLKEHEGQLRRLAELEASNYLELCPSCLKGHMEKRITLRGRDYFECDQCDFKNHKPSKEPHGNS